MPSIRLLFSIYYARSHINFRTLILCSYQFIKIFYVLAISALKSNENELPFLIDIALAEIFFTMDKITENFWEKELNNISARKSKKNISVNENYILKKKDLSSESEEKPYEFVGTPNITLGNIKMDPVSEEYWERIIPSSNIKRPQHNDRDRNENGALDSDDEAHLCDTKKAGSDLSEPSTGSTKASVTASFATKHEVISPEDVDGTQPVFIEPDIGTPAAAALAGNYFSNSKLCSVIIISTIVLPRYCMCTHSPPVYLFASISLST
jgi:hypothetical protein